MALYGSSFESEKNIEEKKLLKRKAREQILNKAKDNFEKEQRRREQKRLRGDDTWMLEDVNERLEEMEQEHSGKKKKKKNKNLKKSKKKKNKKQKPEKNEESSGSSSDSEDEWVESTLETHNTEKAWKIKQKQQSEGTESTSDVKRDEWMTLDFMSIKTTSTASVREEKQKLKIVEQEKAELLKQSQMQARELNPYWRDGGSGLPPEEGDATSVTKASLVEDGGMSWLQKSYQRMKEQSEREHRDLDEIIAARYGSVKIFQSKMEEAKKAASVYSAKEHETRREKWRKLKYSDTEFDKKVKRERKMDSKEQDKGDRIQNFYKDSSRYQDSKAFQHEHREYPRERLRDDGKEPENTVSESEPRDCISRLAVKGSNPLRTSHSSLKYKFLKPCDNDDDDDDTICGTRNQICELQRNSSSSRSLLRNSFRKPQNDSEDSPPWCKAQTKEAKEQEQPNENPMVSPKIIINLEETAKTERCEPQGEHLTDSPDKRRLLTDHKPSTSRHESEEPTQILSEEEMNKLGAKIVKAELMGNVDLALKLKEKLEKARQKREKHTQILPFTKKAETEPRSLQEDHEVLLVKTDQSGRAWPLNAMTEPLEPKGGRRKRQMIATHMDKERIRYFQDDDNHTLQDLVKEEKMGTAEDQNRLFMRMASKFMEKTDKEYYTLDDMFVSKAAKKESTNREEERERQKAISEHRQLVANMEKCPYCFDNAELPKHLIIAIGIKVYLCLPNSLSLTEGHCLIAPLQHHTAATLLDEDIWEEVQTFRKALVKMFETKGLDCVFLETNMNMKKRYHMLYECIPLPKEVGDMAPIYFKKAIMESDEEWSMNKKLIDLSSRDIRKSVPKGLPYFSVNFGLQGGYAHVIEDKYKFPHYFGKEIVGGMLDLEPRLWRKAIRENFDDQRKKVLQFAQWWKPYDFTKTKE